MTLRPAGHASLIGLTVLSMLADKGIFLLNFLSGAALLGLAISAPPFHALGHIVSLCTVGSTLFSVDRRSLWSYAARVHAG